MALNKFSKESDKLANLYRAAYAMAKGYKSQVDYFLKRSTGKFDNIQKNLDRYINDESTRLYWAEKILDEYTGLLRKK